MGRQDDCNPPKKGSTIKCECGFEIIVIPDMEIVGNTIDAHVEEHRKKQKDPSKSEITGKHFQDYLFKKLFEKIYQMNL